MPKKRHHDYLKSSQAQAASAAAAKGKPQKSVNELLTQLRYTSLGASSTAGPATSEPSPATTPTVPPALRRILQIPETPAPRPRRPVRQRFDGNGRRLPAGPPPPRSWTSSSNLHTHRSLTVFKDGSTAINPLHDISLPGLQHPAPRSLIGLVIQQLAGNWAVHRVHHQHFLYYIPSHLKPAIMREISAYSDTGLALGDLKALLLCPGEADDSGGVSPTIAVNSEITALDLTGALGRSLTLKDVNSFLSSVRATAPMPEVLQDSWDAGEEDRPASPPRTLLPNLTHLSLALQPGQAQSPSWRELLSLATQLGSVTHLSLAYWPEPCFLQGAKFATVNSPQGQRIPYSGTSYYSHTLDHDWSEALLVLKKLSQSLYQLEFLDLTGCAPWFKALTVEDRHDYVDWVRNWGKITHLRLNTGWHLTDDDAPSAKAAYHEACEMAASVEKHIVTSRGGRGHFITVERQYVQ